MSCDLRGLSVLVTRPSEQADALCELIEQARGRPVRLPVLEILPPRDPEAAGRLLQEAAKADLLIFVSANAVRHAFPLLPDMLPAGLSIAAVGRATARALEEVGLEPTLVPAGRFDSEGLLALPELGEMEQKRVIIVRGEGGRERLRRTLEERGARVDYAEVYRRSCVRRNTANLVASWEAMVQAVTVTSVGILECLWDLLDERGKSLLRDTHLVVLSERIADRARDLGCRRVVVTKQAGERAILRALCKLAEES